MIPGRYRLECERRGEAAVAAWVPRIESLVSDDGTLRTAAVLMAIDMACGAAAGLAVLPDWTVTADTEVHFLAPVEEGPLRVDAECLRSGKKMSVAQATLVDEGAADKPVAIATANHGVMTPKFQPFFGSMAVGARRRFQVPASPEGESLETYFGLEAMADGGIRAPLGPKTCNPWGIFHGGLHGLLVDAAVRGADAGPLRSMSIRFLNPVREGDAIARVVARHDRGADSILRVEVRDAKNERTASVAHGVCDLRGQS